MQVGELVLFKRSSGQWTYARVADVSLSNSAARAQVVGINCDVDGISTKDVRAEHLPAFIRRFPPAEAEEGGRVGGTAASPP